MFVRILAVSAVLAASALAVPAAQAADKKPPACAAVNFRPLTAPLNDGEQQAGHYKSRFGSIDLKGTVQGGQPTRYHVLINDKPLVPLKGDVPKSTYACLKSKHVATPPQSQQGCLGSRFRVVVDSSSPKQKLIMLYGLHGDDWKLCEAGTPAGG
jgi:hypothetical protein